MTDLAGKAASVHTHTSAQISDATAAATASTVVLRDGSAGANFAYVAANNLWGYADSHLQSVECGAFQTVGAPYENMLKYSEDFSVATWDKNGGTCTVTANSVLAPDGNQTADTVTASGAAGLIRQNISGLVANGQYTFYVWLKGRERNDDCVARHPRQRLDHVAYRSHCGDGHHPVAAVQGDGQR